MGLKLSNYINKLIFFILIVFISNAQAQHKSFDFACPLKLDPEQAVLWVQFDLKAIQKKEALFDAIEILAQAESKLKTLALYPPQGIWIVLVPHPNFAEIILKYPGVIDIQNEQTLLNALILEIEKELLGVDSQWVSATVLRSKFDRIQKALQKAASGSEGLREIYRDLLQLKLEIIRTQLEYQTTQTQRLIQVNAQEGLLSKLVEEIDAIKDPYKKDKIFRWYQALTVEFKSAQDPIVFQALIDELDELRFEVNDLIGFWSQLERMTHHPGFIFNSEATRRESQDKKSEEKKFESILEKAFPDLNEFLTVQSLLQKMNQEGLALKLRIRLRVLVAQRPLVGADQSQWKNQLRSWLTDLTLWSDS